MNERLQGLTDAEVEKSRRLHGTNSLKKAKTKGFFGKFLEKKRKFCAKNVAHAQK